MVLHNPNNWHWVNKDAGPWAKEFLEAKVKQISAEDNGVSAQITKLVSMDGDVDVSQRKGKVITIFDVSLQLEYEGMRFERERRERDD
jgi:activator of HSP90 ATPase